MGLIQPTGFKLGQGPTRDMAKRDGINPVSSVSETLASFRQGLHLETARIAIALTPHTVPPAESIESRLAQHPEAREDPRLLLLPAEAEHLFDAKCLVRSTAELAVHYAAKLDFKPNIGPMVQ